ncbi:alpha-tubulin suppressor-like RCC1 family protein [Actinophytocola algeriensis]|uniref:Alpha-tubulin suppressor-like RCC1 family protein n=1 Tax=Actinophytocola algeriensis TaxID=1768010 RepID=A0A7W7VBR3_9PSEU|nr:alpha-tubulin suppressor-like RCC1 family protein [Actinophytocola algeriensis]
MTVLASAITTWGLTTPATAQPLGSSSGSAALSWGNRGDGALGNGDTSKRSRPTLVCAQGTTNCASDPLTGVTSLVASGGHTLALRADNTVLGWGRNGSGELGIGINADRGTPVPVCAVGATDCTTDPLTNVAAVAAGERHSLGLLADGTLLSWGSNEHGQLGHFATGYATSPRPVCAVGATDCAADPLTNVATIAAGQRHSVAVLTDGTVLSWGDGAFGQLGNGTTNDQDTPAPVCAVGATDCAADPLNDVTTLSVGGAHNLARRADGTVVSWGSNLTGQLGDGTMTDRTTPAPVCAPGATDCAADPLVGVTGLAAGGAVQSQDGLWGTSLALTTAGTVLAWGHNGYGQVGDTTTTDRTTPVQVCAVGATDCGADPLTGVSAIAAGGLHSQALLGGGQVLSWGENEDGQLGDYSTTNRGTPVPVCASTATADCAAAPLTGVTALAPGSSHSTALLPDGRVLAWGDGSGRQLGDGVPGQARPAAVCAPGSADCATDQLADLTAVAAGGGSDGFGSSGYSLALRADGSVLGWGFNGHGQVGDGTSAHSSVPHPVCAVGATDCAADPLTGAIAIAAGGNHSLALLSNGQVLAWGDNWLGQLGDGTSNTRYKPVPVCAVGATDCTADPLTGVVAIAAGGNHSVAVLSDGRAVAWGDNDSGQLGDGTTTTRRSPVLVCASRAVDCAADPLTGVSSVDGGAERTVALLSTGSVLTWGRNKTTPAPVCAVGATNCATNPLTGAIAVSAGDHHNLALLSDHTVVGWGANYSGELGDGTTDYRSTTVRVCAVDATDCASNPLSNVSAISAGTTQSAAVVNGTAVSWGINVDGRVGDGTATDRSTPTVVCAPGAANCAADPLTGVDAISVGYGHVLAVRD